MVRERQLVLYGMEVTLPKIGDYDWRFQTSNGYTWRLARAEELPLIEDLWCVQESVIGKQDKPDLFNIPVVLTLVAENEAGEIVEALYAEAVVEFTSIGAERGALRSVNELFPHLRRFCGDRSLRVARVNVPRGIARMVRKFLPGLVQLDEELSQFVFRIRD